jgi:heat-inducible transcriptional repressor
MTLQPRQKALLAAVIERYVETAEPIGSAAVVNDPVFVSRVGRVSSATVRNELAELEALGLLAHPHTSAGRVPTDAGYRFYVNEILQPRRVKAAEMRQIQAQVATPATSLEDALRDACAILARLTGYPAVATLPGGARDTFRHLQINSLPPRRLILVLVTSSGRVEHRLFDIADDVPAERLAQVVNFMNQQLSGRSIASLRSLEFSDISAGLHGSETIVIASKAFSWVQQSIAGLDDERIVVQGLVTLLDEPEFSDIATARAAMRMFEDEAAVAELMRAPLDQFELGGEMYGRLHDMRAPDALGMPYAVVIGREMSGVDPAAARFSLVGIAYGAGGETFGTVGVMGPTRMKYTDAAALVPVLAARLRSSLETL